MSRDPAEAKYLVTPPPFPVVGEGVEVGWWVTVLTSLAPPPPPGPDPAECPRRKRGALAALGADVGFFVVRRGEAFSAEATVSDRLE